MERGRAGGGRGDVCSCAKPNWNGHVTMILVGVCAGLLGSRLSKPAVASVMVNAQKTVERRITSTIVSRLGVFCFLFYFPPPAIFARRDTHLHTAFCAQRTTLLGSVQSDQSGAVCYSVACIRSHKVVTCARGGVHLLAWVW